MDTEVFQLKIEPGTDGLKIWNKAYFRHVQKGPDLLIISTPDCSLNFKTTLMPGAQIGCLHCVIAGELASFEAMDFLPEDWQALSDKLTNRNRTQIIKKSTTEKNIIKMLEEQQTASEKARLEYKKTGDSNVVIRFIMNDYSGETMKEQWVVNVLSEWHREKRKDLFAKLYSPKGRPEASYLRKLEDLIFVDRIDRYKAEQGSLSAAIITEMERLAGGKLYEVDERVFQKLANNYQRYKKIPTVCRVIEEPDHYEIILYASKVTLGERPIARGTAKCKFPKK